MKLEELILVAMVICGMSSVFSVKFPVLFKMVYGMVLGDSVLRCVDQSLGFVPVSCA